MQQGSLLRAVVVLAGCLGGLVLFSVVLVGLLVSSRRQQVQEQGVPPPTDVHEQPETRRDVPTVERRCARRNRTESCTELLPRSPSRSMSVVSQTNRASNVIYSTINRNCEPSCTTPSEKEAHYEPMTGSRLSQLALLRQGGDGRDPRRVSILQHAVPQLVSADADTQGSSCSLASVHSQETYTPMTGKVEEGRPAHAWEQRNQQQFHPHWSHHIYETVKERNVLQNADCIPKRKHQVDKKSRFRSSSFVAQENVMPLVTYQIHDYTRPNKRKLSF